MTKDEAKQAMLEYERAVIAPEEAEKILGAFGESLDSLNVTVHDTNQYDRLNYRPEDAEEPSVAVFQLARDLAEKLTGERVSSGMNGRGSYADDITRKAVALL